jgi:hypothetical protein
MRSFFSYRLPVFAAALLVALLPVAASASTVSTISTAAVERQSNGAWDSSIEASPVAPSVEV